MKQPWKNEGNPADIRSDADDAVRSGNSDEASEASAGRSRFGGSRGQQKPAVSFYTVLVLILIIGTAFAISQRMNAKQADNAPKGKWKVTVVDAADGKPVAGVTLVFPDLTTSVSLPADGSDIELPVMEDYSSEGWYPLGYTMITTAEGYVPRIDHNLPKGDAAKATEVRVELEKKSGQENRPFVEIWHETPADGLKMLFEHYGIE